MKFLTVAEVAAMMRVSKMTVYRLLHNGELPAVRVGRSFRVVESVICCRAARVDRQRGFRARRELRGEAGDRVNAVRVSRRVLHACRLGLTRDIEMVALATAAERGVAEFSVQARAGEHERVVDG